MTMPFGKRILAAIDEALAAPPGFGVDDPVPGEDEPDPPDLWPDDEDEEPDDVRGR